MAQVIDTSAIANEFGEVIKSRVEELKESGIHPKLATISVGDSKNNILFSSRKDDLAQFVGIKTENYSLSEDAKFEKFAELINKLNEDKSVHGILLQPSLPRKLSFRNTVNLILPEKDVDGLTTVNQGHLFSGEPGIIPCVPLGVLHLLRIIHGDIAGMHAVVIGRSSTVGRPLAQLLLNANCTVTLLHSYSRDLENMCKTADILVSAAGSPRFVKGDFIKKGATVLDVGLSRVDDKNGGFEMVGDVDFESVAEEAGAITSVPDGVSPMTLAYLMHNTLKLAYCY